MKSIKSLLLVLTLLASNASSLFAGKLLKFVKKNNLEAVSKYLETNGNTKINKPNDSGKTPLFVACEKNNLKIAELLLKNGAKDSINTPDDSEKTPLFVACEENNLEIAELLLKNGANPNIKDEGDNAPLHRCTNNVPLLKLLLDNGANPNIKQFGETLLHSACSNWMSAIVEILLSYGADPNIPNNNGKTPSFEPFYDKNNTKILTLLSKKDMALALSYACQYNNFEEVQRLLDNDAKPFINTPNKAGRTPFWLACFNKNFKIIKLLLKNGAKPNIPLNDLLHPAYGQNDFEMVEFLLKNGANPNTQDKNKQTLFLLAYTHNDLKMIKLLLQNGINPNTQYILDKTMLYRAADKKNVELVTLLLKNGADATIKATNGKTPISIICSNKWTTKQRKQLLMSLIPTEKNLPQNANIFIELVIATLAEEMQKDATVAPKVPLTDTLFTMTNVTEDPTKEIARIEKFVKTLLFEPREKQQTGPVKNTKKTETKSTVKFEDVTDQNEKK